MKIKFIDLFAGCGGLMEGFMQSGLYESVASVEWEKAPVSVMKDRLKNKWNIKNVDQHVMLFDMQREDELFDGYSDVNFGSNLGLDKHVSTSGGVDIIIGGPPCQAYSVAGRNANRMNSDYRNYLFEHYVSVLNRYRPKIFVFENVPGILSAMPDGPLITDLIKRDLKKIGYEITDDLKKYALIDMSEFGVPQNRKRVILIGIRDDVGIIDIQASIKEFYVDYLSKYKINKTITLEEAIGDLPRLLPLDNPVKINGKNTSHIIENQTNISWNVPRYANPRDVQLFKMLAKDIETNENKYNSMSSLIDLYKEVTGKKTSVHKYHVLRKDKPSTTILAHLYKDGYRFIHYDSSQARTITVREAARIQTFPDDFEFNCAMGSAYKMIGNAVPPKFAYLLSKALYNYIIDKDLINL
jgi:DNA (cytosine-5)-methyltransferase 1